MYVCMYIYIYIYITCPKSDTLELPLEPRTALDMYTEKRFAKAAAQFREAGFTPRDQHLASWAGLCSPETSNAWSDGLCRCGARVMSATCVGVGAGREHANLLQCI